MKKAQAMTNAYPSEIVDLLGPPALWPSEDRDLYLKILAHTAADLRPSDAIGWMMAKNLVDQIFEIIRYRRLQTAWMQVKFDDIKSAQISQLDAEVQQSPTIAKRWDLESNLDKLNRRLPGSESLNEEGLKRQLARLVAEEDARLAKLKERISTVSSEETTEGEFLGFISTWGRVYEILGRMLRAAEDQFDETRAEIEQHYRGLGRRIRERFEGIIEGTIIERSTS